MFNWFRKKEGKKKETPIEASVIPMKPMNYHPKIILAWSKAVEGDMEFLEWLTENGYAELTIACSAIHLKDDARNWLMKNTVQFVL